MNSSSGSKKAKLNPTSIRESLPPSRAVSGLKDLLDDTTLKEDREHYFVRSASDFSYAADRYAGDYFELVECIRFAKLTFCTAFIDPFFSSGVHLALLRCHKCMHAFFCTNTSPPGLLG